MKIKRYTRELETLNSELKSIEESIYVHTKDEVLDNAKQFRELATKCIETLAEDKRAIQFIVLDTEPSIDSMKQALNDIYLHFGIDAKI